MFNSNLIMKENHFHEHISLAVDSSLWDGSAQSMLPILPYFPWYYGPIIFYITNNVHKALMSIISNIHNSKNKVISNT